MMHGRNNGKKLLAIRIVKSSFEIIHLLTGEVRAYRIVQNHLLAEPRSSARQCRHQQRTA
jgi:small subunit ribosomal protein S5e